MKTASILKNYFLFEEILFISAKKKKGLDKLEQGQEKKWKLN